MIKRKTIDVKVIKDKVNHQNKGSTCSSEVRDGWNSLLEQILMDTGNYKGFSFLSSKEVPENCLPGIIISDNGNEFPDETRRIYI